MFWYKTKIAKSIILDNGFTTEKTNKEIVHLKIEKLGIKIVQYRCGPNHMKLTMPGIFFFVVNHNHWQKQAYMQCVAIQ